MKVSDLSCEITECSIKYKITTLDTKYKSESEYRDKFSDLVLFLKINIVGWHKSDMLSFKLSLLSLFQLHWLRGVKDLVSIAPKTYSKKGLITQTNTYLKAKQVSHELEYIANKLQCFSLFFFLPTTSRFFLYDSLSSFFL